MPEWGPKVLRNQRWIWGVKVPRAWPLNDLRVSSDGYDRTFHKAELNSKQIYFYKLVRISSILLSIFQNSSVYNYKNEIKIHINSKWLTLVLEPLEVITGIGLTWLAANACKWKAFIQSLWVNIIAHILRNVLDHSVAQEILGITWCHFLETVLKANFGEGLSQS